jgi:hypothetical protein
MVGTNDMGGSPLKHGNRNSPCFEGTMFRVSFVPRNMCWVASEPMRHLRPIIQITSGGVKANNGKFEHFLAHCLTPSY